MNNLQGEADKRSIHFLPKIEKRVVAAQDSKLEVTSDEEN